MKSSTPSRRRIVVLISGSGTNLQALIDATLRGEINGDIVGVVSNRPSAYGLVRAASAQIPHQVVPFAPFKTRQDAREEYDRHLADVVEPLEPDWIVLAGFMRILGANFLSRFENRVINLHPALPGAFPGTDAIARAWTAHTEEGLEETGVMVHFVVEEVDAGPVLGTRTLPISEFDSLVDLEVAMHTIEHELLTEVVCSLCNRSS